MSIVEIRDYALWPQHIHGNDVLKHKLLQLEEGVLIELVVGGIRGMWKKMDDGKDGRPTTGIKGIGKAQEHWHDLYRKRRGDLIDIEEA